MLRDSSAGLAPLAIGTETDGSIVCPASVNGIVGIKPTVGLVSTQGIVPISRSQDTAGPMAGNVQDAARLLAALLSWQENQKTAALATQLKQLKPAELAGKRIGVLRSAAGFHEGVDELFNQSIELFESEGVVIVDELRLKPYDGYRKDAYDVLLYEFKSGLNDYLSGLPGTLSHLNLSKLIEFNESHKSREMEYFGQEIFIKAQAKGDLNRREYLDALTRVQNASGKEGLELLIDTNHLDALIAPTTSAAWTIDQINGDHYLGGFSSYPAIAGYPHITLPMGKLHNLPVGISLTGPALSDARLAALAMAFEQSLDGS